MTQPAKKHTEPTPGPWEVGGGQSVWMASQSDVRHVRINGPRGAIAVVPLWPNTWEGEANAHLIAASPNTAAERDRLKAANAELIYACQILIRLVGLKVLGDTPSEVKTALAALAKAQELAP